MALQQIGVAFFSGLSSDTKPTLTTSNAGATFYETDTKKTYTYSGTAWEEQVPGLPPTLPPGGKITYITGGNQAGAVMVGGSNSGTPGTAGEIHAAKDYTPGTT